MINYVIKSAFFLLLIFCAALCQAADPASTSSPEGEWLVKDATAHIRIISCESKLWGIISWVDAPGGKDKENPDVAKRNRPVLGLPILLSMQASDAQTWQGHVYNAENGKTYEGSIWLKSEDILQIQGCVLGILCGSENWTRLPADPSAEPADAICKQMNAG